MFKTRFLLASTLLLLFNSAATSQTFPIKPIKLIIPYTTGGTTDIYARMLTANMTKILNQQITAKFAQGRKWLQVFELDSEIESLLGSAIQYTSSGMYSTLEPEVTQEIFAAISTTVAASDPAAADAPILVTMIEIRRFVRNLVSLKFPSLHVVSREDLDPGLQLRTVARIRLSRT